MVKKEELAISPKVEGLGDIQNIKRASNFLPGVGSILMGAETESSKRISFGKEIEKVDKKALVSLRDRLSNCPDSQLQSFLNDAKNKREIENAINVLIQYMDRFNKMNSDDSRKVALRERELKLEARHDWADKGRTFLFRILASALFIITLFTIGYLEKNYDWAVLPLSKYVSTNLPSE